MPNETSVRLPMSMTVMRRAFRKETPEALSAFRARVRIRKKKKKGDTEGWSEQDDAKKHVIDIDADDACWNDPWYEYPHLSEDLIASLEKTGRGKSEQALYLCLLAWRDRANEYRTQMQQLDPEPTTARELLDAIEKITPEGAAAARRFLERAGKDLDLTTASMAREAFNDDWWGMPSLRESNEARLAYHLAHTTRASKINHEPTPKKRGIRLILT